VNSILYNEKGVALVVTLAIVAILIAAAFQLSKFTGDSAMSAMAEKDRFQAGQMALSGINLAMMILARDAADNTIDSVQEAWADPDRLSTAVNELGFDTDTLTIKIIDELSKIQVNALLAKFPGNLINPDQMRIWEHFFTLEFSNDKEMDERDPEKIINSIKDWLDSGDDDTISGLSGAESDYYLGLEPPYECANGPFNYIDELLSVKGIPTDFLQNKIQAETEENAKVPQLSELFTVYGLDPEKDGNGYKYPGRVNINTAGIDVLAVLLPEGMEAFAQDLADFRDEKEETGDTYINLLDKGWYEEVIALSKTEKIKFESTIRYSSDIFKVECVGRQADARVTLSAFVKRRKDKESGKWMCRIIQMERK